MTVSRAFWKIALKNIGTIILYTGMLVLFGTMNILVLRQHSLRHRNRQS